MDGLELSRREAVGRAQEFAPFLRDTIAARPEVAETFLNDGARAAAEVVLAAGAESAGAELRRRPRLTAGSRRGAA